jgi:NADH-quinone oxidoreductase subunit N
LISNSDFSNSIPLIIVAASALIIMILEIIFPKDHKKKSETAIFYYSLAALIAALIFSFEIINRNVLAYNNYMRVTALTVSLNIILILGMFITVLSSKEYLEQEGINYGEYYSLLFFSLLGMMIMVSSNDLITVFIGLELMSVCFYVLAGFMRTRIESNESALKYFLLGAFFTGFFLLGIAFIYGFTGVTNYTTITNLRVQKTTFFMLGIVLVYIAFIFKTGSFPLQMWIPDVYQGAPTIVTGMMSSIGKTAAFGALITIFTAFEVMNIPLLISIIAILTMLYGNVVALMQTNIKRLLAYSSIAHAGYIMIGFIIISTEATHAILFYLLAYLFMQLGAFIIVSIVEERYDVSPDVNIRNNIESYKGLGKTNPGLASVLSIFLFSLAGIPPFAGFWGKYYIFLTAIEINYVWVAVIGILLSLVGVYYYIKIILFMWFYEPGLETLKTTKKNFAFTAAIISTVGLLVFGIYPDFALRVIKLIS